MSNSPDHVAFNRDEQVKYWSAHGHANKGEGIAPAVVSIAGRWIGARALDVGASSGAIMRALRARRPDAEVVGIDLVPMSPEVQEGDCTALAFADGAFDTVTCTDVIEHLADADVDKCIREMRRVLRPGGCVVITTINDENLADLMVSCPGCDRRFHAFGHCQVFTPERLERELESRGFEVLRTVTTHLHLHAGHPWIMRIVAALGIDRMLGVKQLRRDLLVVARAR